MGYIVKCKILVLLMLMVALTSFSTVWAVPAKRGAIEVMQPDGTTIKLYIKGDEFFSWRESEAGYPIAEGEDGYFYYASYSTVGEVKITTCRVSIDGRIQSPPSGVTRQNVAALTSRSISRCSAQREVATRTTSSSGFPSEGTVKAAVILVEYSDVKFSVSNPNQAFHNQLNQEGYSVSGATGSARDYFAASSRGKFDGQFDVYGPYTLPHERSYYGKNDDDGHDERPDKMVWDGVALADVDVDFSQYDSDNDGYIDNVFVYYAGHNEAEGATADSVWPHMWAVNDRPQFDGKHLYVYACTSELRGTRGSTIAGIGTFCHEFSHIFGLADHYDTTGEDDGESYGLGFYDIMSSGSYNNNGNTPPLHNGLELDMIGWNSPITLDSNAEITIQPIQNGEVYKILTEVDGEYFLIENRQSISTVWDRYISASGLFITHVDRSSSQSLKWGNDNSPNGDLSHECFKFVVAGDSPLVTFADEKLVPYPYNKNNQWSSSSSPAALSWSGAELGVGIYDIAQNSDGSVTFRVSAMQILSGQVININGSPVANAAISITANSGDGANYQLITDSDGRYSIDLLAGFYSIEITAPLYVNFYDVVEVANGDNDINFQLTSYGDSIEGLVIDALQSQASLSWNPQSYTSFVISISGNDYFEDIEVDDCIYEFENLTPDTRYNLIVSGVEPSGDRVELYSDSFTTIAQVTSIPLIMFDKYRYSAGESIALKMMNTQKGDVVTWLINGEEQKNATATLESGEYTIQGVVERGAQRFRVNRLIYVE